MSINPDNMKVVLSASEVSVEPGQAAELVISIKNLSEVVDQYQLEVADLNPAWLDIAVGSVSLFPHDEDSLRLAFRPPRDSSARSGEHPFRVLIRSREHPEATYGATLVLKIAPFVGFETRLSPEVLVTKGRGSFELNLANTGNCPLTFDLSATDSEQGCLLAFQPAQVTVEPGQSTTCALEAEPKAKPKIGSAKLYPVQVVVAPQGAEPRTLNCQVSYQPPIPRWMPVAAVAAAVAVLALAFSLLRSPAEIRSFEVKPGNQVTAGQPVTLNWDVLGASRISITPQPGEDLQPKGSVQLTPSQTTIYKLTAKKGWAGAVEKQIEVKVIPVLKQFEAVVGAKAGVKVEAPQGERVVLRWEVAGADKVNISPLGTRPAKGQETITATQPTDYVLTAEGGQLEGHVHVEVTSVPVVQSFLAQPPQIAKGQSATLSWNVTGVDTVDISGVGKVPAQGTRVVKPRHPTNYTLSASNSAGSRQMLASIDVVEQAGTVAAAVAAASKAPTEIPFIRKFEAYPLKIGAFGETTLSWEVIGAERVVIDSGIGEVDPQKGRLKKSIKLPGTAVFTLTATNSLGKSTAKVRVQVGVF